MSGLSQGGPACLDEDTLAAFADGHTEPGEQGTIEAHLADCRDCRVVLARTAGAEDAIADNQSDSAAVADALPIVPAGTEVGRYVVERLIGRGAMGVVYLARDPDLDRRVAVKLLRAGELPPAALSQMRARLLREAQAMARLSHPEVIAVYDVGAFGDQLFVAMEYVEGETLRQWRITRHRGHGEILAAYERAGSGLAAAHEAGLVHRDFKPDNVLVGRDGRVRVTDFGLARGVGHADVGPEERPESDRSGERCLTVTLTRTGTLLGTPAYMAPEQLHGNPADARSDVFSYCVALYEALYGERPFAGVTVQALRASIEAGVVRAAPVMSPAPAWARTVLLRGLRALPSERFASMRELLDALRATHASAQRRKRRVAAGALAGLALASVGWLSLSRAWEPRHEGVASAPLPIVTQGPGTPAAPPPPPPVAMASAAEVPASIAPLQHARPASRPLAAAAAPAVSVRSAPLVGKNGAFILE